MVRVKVLLEGHPIVCLVFLIITAVKRVVYCSTLEGGGCDSRGMEVESSRNVGSEIH